MADAVNGSYKTTLTYTPATSLVDGEIVQMADGRAGVVIGDIGSGNEGSVAVDGRWTVTKATSVYFVDGAKVWWDHSANQATYRPTNDRDFFLGVAVGDASSSSTTMSIALNVQPVYLLDLARDPYVTAPVGTQALGGFLPPQRNGGTLTFALTSTSEAQKVDALSKDGFSTAANAIVELEFAVVSDGSGTVVDVSMGIANATHATDADSITDSLFIHLDANSVNILAESDDGTTEVTATDTTIDYTEGAGNRVYVVMDMRNPADVQIYINGALILGSTVFNLNASVATWKLLVHVEKTSSTDTYQLDIDALRVRIAEK